MVNGFVSRHAVEFVEQGGGEVHRTPGLGHSGDWGTVMLTAAGAVRVVDGEEQAVIVAARASRTDTHVSHARTSRSGLALRLDLVAAVADALEVLVAMVIARLDVIADRGERGVAYLADGIAV